MGEKLHTMIKALQERMDSGVLNDLNTTRLNMLIGEELVKKSIDIADDDRIIDLLESAMQKYFGMQIPEDRNIQSKDGSELAEKKIPEQKKSVGFLTSKEPIQFKLNIKKNKNSHITSINGTQVLFSSFHMRKSLTSIIMEQFTEVKMESLRKLTEMTAYENTFKMLCNFFTLAGTLTLDQKIRLGFIIYRLLGLGDYKLENNNPVWNITFMHNDKSVADKDYLALGFTKGIFAAADEILYNHLNFLLFRNIENTIIKIS